MNHIPPMALLSAEDEILMLQQVPSELTIDFSFRDSDPANVAWRMVDGKVHIEPDNVTIVTDKVEIMITSWSGHTIVLLTDEQGREIEATYD